MRGQVGERNRRATRLQLGGCSHHSRLERPGQANRHHVLRDHFTQAYPGIKSRSDDIDEAWKLFAI
jgi:hypothetical protein